MIRYDLRIRYIPPDFLDKLKDDKTTMIYFYQQVITCPVGSVSSHLPLHIL